MSAKRGRPVQQYATAMIYLVVALAVFGGFMLVPENDLFLKINKSIDVFGRVYKEGATSYVDEIELRRQAAGQSFDRMESSGRVFYERVRAGFRALAEHLPERVVCVDGTRSIDDVHEEIWALLVNRECIQQ